MKKSRFTEGQIMAALRQAEGGMPVPDLRRQLAEGGRKRLEERFSRQSIVDRYLDLFEELRNQRA